MKDEFRARARREFESAPERSIVVACESCEVVRTFDTTYEAFDFFRAHLHRWSVAG